MPYRRTPAVEARMAGRRADLLRAARDVLAADGLHAVAVGEVAARAGVSVGTLYRYFPTKADLLGEVVDHVCRHEIDLVAKVAAEPSDAATRLSGAVDTFARRAAASGRTAHAVIAEPAPADTEHRRVELRRSLAHAFARIVADGVDEGRFPPQDPLISGTAIVGAVSEVVVGPLGPLGSVDPDRAALVAGGREPVELDAVLAATVALVQRLVGATPDPGGTTP